MKIILMANLIFISLVSFNAHATQIDICQFMGEVASKPIKGEKHVSFDFQILKAVVVEEKGLIPEGCPNWVGRINSVLMTKADFDGSNLIKGSKAEMMGFYQSSGGSLVFPRGNSDE